MKDIGFQEGIVAPTVMTNPETDVRLVVHGDDFTFLGPEEELRKLAEQMGQWYEIKVRGILGPDTGDDKEITILNRIVKWEKNGDITYRADPKHAEIVVRDYV